MTNTAIREALVTILKSKRRTMSRAQRRRGVRPVRWLYPWTTEKHYSAAIRAWFRPVRDYVKNYLKDHGQDVLRGDSAAQVKRQDATPGKTFKVMVNSLNAWVGQYISDDPQKRPVSPIYTGLGNIAETTFNFNEGQYEKSAKAALGIEFPVGEDWWPDAKETWQDRNYEMIQSDLKKYIGQIDDLTERAVTSGWSASSLAQEILAMDSKISQGRANFIARDQIGKLNGHISQRRMESAGLSMYEWMTSGDERVRESHRIMDGLLCRWDDPTVYSDDGGKTWRDRPSGAVLLHPGDDFQCRCTALAYWQEIVGEVDEQIDLLGGSVDNIPDSGKEGLAVMNPPKARTKNEGLKEQQKAQEQRRRQENAKKAKQFADEKFPGEKWKKVEDGIYLSPRRPVGEGSNYQEEKKDAEILRDFGSTVYLIPYSTRAKSKQYDAIVNDDKMEFKNSGGSLGTIKGYFLKSRTQAPNVFLNLEKANFTKSEVITALYGARNSARYAQKNEFPGGKIILKLKGEKNLVYLNVDDLKIDK